MNQTSPVSSPSANYAPRVHQNQQHETLSSPDRVWRWHLNQVIGQHLCPVALPTESITLKPWGKKTLRETFNGHSLSLELRFYFMTLYYLVRNTAGWKLGFITVNFSQSMTDKLAKEAARAPATKHADLVNKRLRKLGIDVRWFGVLEDHQGNLHSHSVVAYHEDDEKALKVCFGQDTDLKNSGYRLQHIYKQRCKTMTKPHLLQQPFPYQDARGKFRHAQIDVAVADYMSKTLEKSSRYMDAGRCRIYVPKVVRSQSSERYEQARIKQQRMTSAKTDLSGLSLHQSMTFLYRGWIPVIEEDADQRYEEQAAEIEEWMDRNDFQNNSPAYDWQYEEGDAELDAYLEVERWMAAEPSEHDYEQAVLAAEAAWERELRALELSEAEYDWVVSEAAFLARQQWKARQLSERDYDLLMLEVDAFLDHQRWTQRFPGEADTDVPDDEIEAFVRQEGLSELVELITEHRDTLVEERPYTLSLGASRATIGAVTDTSITAVDSARTAETIDKALGDSDGHASSHLTLNSTLQNARRRPCERSGRRGIAAHYSDARTPLRRSLTRYKALPEQVSTPRDRRCLGPPQGTARWSSDEQGYGASSRRRRPSSHPNAGSSWAGHQETSVLTFAGSQRGSPRSESKSRVNSRYLGPQGVARHTIPSQE